jgi:hypothetical protein
MKKFKFYIFASGTLICLLLLASGCSEQVKLALKFKPGQTESYRLQTVSQRKVTLESPKSENSANFQGGQTTDRIEMVFDQQIQSIDTAGNATEKITIKELKYFEEIKDKTVLDFNSLGDNNPNDALAALIGQSYIIKIAPSGKVSSIVDVNDALQAIKNKPSNNAAAVSLLSDKTIVRQHSIPLPDSNNNELKIGDKWSNITKFDFGLMGLKYYERTYILEKIEEDDGNLDTIIEMNATPSIAGEKEIYQERGQAAVPPMTDVRLTYTGQMKFDVTDGTLIKYLENLKNEWLIVPPISGEAGPPSALNMTATQTYNIEKLK